MTKKQEKFLSTPIARLKLSSVSRNRLLSYIGGKRGMSPEHRWRLTPALCAKYGNEYTIGHALAALTQDARARPTPRPERREHVPLYQEQLAKLASDAGFTKLEYIFLPRRTVNLQMLKKLPKEVLMGVPLDIIETVTSGMLATVAQEIEKPPLTVTVQDLLNSESDSLRRRVFYFHKKSASRTQDYFKYLGFRYEDGFFMQYRTDRQAAEKLMEEESISRRDANLVVRIAKRRSWQLWQGSLW